MLRDIVLFAFSVKQHVDEVDSLVKENIIELIIYSNILSNLNFVQRLLIRSRL